MIAPNADLMRLLKAAIDLGISPAAAASEVVRIGESRFRLIAEHSEAGGWIVILIQEPPDDSVCDEVIKACYGLTDRELQVARLLADRLSNREIAERLGFTVYTAGRHTEHVLKKLGVASRKDVRRKLEEPPGGE